MRKRFGLLAAVLLTWVLSIAPVQAGDGAQLLSPLVTFDPNSSTSQPAELPEGLATDANGNLYVGLALTRQIRRISDTGAVAQVAEIPGRSEGGVMTGLVYNPADNAIYAAVAAPGTSNHGIWRVSPGGGMQRMAQLTGARFPNGLAIRGSNLYVSDSKEGAIWRVALRTPAADTTQMGGSTGGSAENERLWFQHDLLKGDADGNGVGANGIVFVNAFTRDGISGTATWLYVANTDTGKILRVRVPSDGTSSPMQIETFVDNRELLRGADGIAVDERGYLYVSVNRQHRLVRIGAEPDRRTLLMAEGGILQFPASVVVRSGMLYVANSAQETHGDAARPAVLQMRLSALESGGVSQSSNPPAPRPREVVKRAG
jgi:sugar lactone lactonase YvrE